MRVVLLFLTVIYSLAAFEAKAAIADLTVMNVLGEEYQIKEYHGDLILVHFWASWCPPCIQGLPMMDQAYPGLVAHGITLLPVAVEDVTAAHLKGFYEQAGVTRLPIYRVPSRTNFRQVMGFPLSVMPTTLVLDSEYEVRKVIPGPINWSDPMVIRGLFDF